MITINILEIELEWVRYFLIKKYIISVVTIYFLFYYCIIIMKLVFIVVAKCLVIGQETTLIYIAETAYMGSLLIAFVCLFVDWPSLINYGGTTFYLLSCI